MSATVVAGWHVHHIYGGSGTLSHAWFATAPGCPLDRHPTRWCACKVHLTKTDAEEYVREQIGDLHA